MVSQGSRKIGVTSRNVSEDEAMVEGKTYEATYQVTGIRQLIPGWENDVINQVTNQLASQGATVTYINISGNTVTVQWEYQHLYGQFTAAVLPVIAVYAIAAVVITVCAYILSLTLVGFVKEIGTAITESPQTQMLVYAGIAIIFLYLLNQRSRSSSKS
ncbi:MAG TPA: hypothetical protein PLW50_00420 [Smithellaceae bacterium]|nr:hypothetical protein [Smithellaceae bacterium]